MTRLTTAAHDTAADAVLANYRSERRYKSPFMAATAVRDVAAMWVAMDVDEGRTPTWTIEAYRIARGWAAAAYERSGGEDRVPVEGRSRRQKFWLHGRIAPVAAVVVSA